MQENKGTWPTVKKEDFGLEIIFPKFASATTKVTAIESFIWLCKLSNIMRDIANFHEKRRFDREWADKLVDETDVVPELAQVSRFSNQLKNWKEEYLKVSGEYIKSIRPGTSKMPSYVLIICK
jgi:GTP1/Obg family GTP-binding protein